MSRLKFVAICGLRGRGKSALMTSRLYAASKRQEHVMTNEWLSVEDPLKRFTHYFEDPNDLLYMRDCVVGIDEGHLRLSSRSWKDLKPETHAALSLSRQFGLNEFYICTQNYKRVDTIVRELVDEIWFVNRIWRLTYWIVIYPKELDSNGEIAKTNGITKLFRFLSIIIGGQMYWHTKKLHEIYDDKQYRLLYPSLNPDAWIPNGDGVPEELKRPQNLPKWEALRALGDE